MGLSRNVGEADDVGADAVGGGEAQAGAWAGEIAFSLTDHDGVEIHPVFVDEA